MMEKYKFAPRLVESHLKGLIQNIMELQRQLAKYHKLHVILQNL